MGFISNIAGVVSDSINSELQDQYLEAFRTDSLGQDTLVRRAKRTNSKGFNQGSSDIISAGSKVIVPEGTYALMIDNDQFSQAALRASCQMLSTDSDSRARSRKPRGSTTSTPSR